MNEPLIRADHIAKRYRVPQAEVKRRNPGLETVSPGEPVLIWL